MSNRRKTLVVAALLAAVGAPALMAAGMYSTLPIVGDTSFCASTVTGTGSFGGITGQGQGTIGSICAQTIPAGPPAITGVEVIPADTNLTGGAPPQTVGIPTALLGSHTNRLIGGDFATNLWQRGTTSPSSATVPQGNIGGADRWYAFSTGNTVTVSKQTAAADSLPAQGLYASMRVARATGSDVTPICVGQVLDKEAAQTLLGTNGIFSFYAMSGANFSAANSNITAQISYYTAADSNTPATNTNLFAKGTITGFTNVVNATAATFPISTTWTRYSVFGPIPTANASGTAVTGAGVSICFTPVGTAGANDWFEIEGAQLEAAPSTVTASLPNGVTSPSAFDRRYPSIESELQYFYSFVLTEPLSPTAVIGGSVTTSTNCKVAYPLPNTMRVAPTFATTTITSPNNWEVRDTNSTFAVSAIATAGANTVNQLSLNVTSVGLTGGHACVLEGNNSGGSLGIASSEP